MLAGRESDGKLSFELELGADAGNEGTGVVAEQEIISGAEELDTGGAFFQTEGSGLIW